MKLTNDDKREREALVKEYNRSRRRDSKAERYQRLMAFEDRMLSEGKNG